MLVPRRSGPFALAVLGALLLWSAAPTARADLVFWVSGIDGCQPQGDLVSCLGQTVSIDLTLRNPDALDVAVLSATATGYGTVAQYSGAEGVSDLLNPFCLAPPGPCVGGLIASGPTGGAPFESPLGTLYVIHHLRIPPAFGTGAIDPGWDGMPGSAQFRISFDIAQYGLETVTLDFEQAAGPGLVDLLDETNGIELVFDGAVDPTVTYLPEPGATISLTLAIATLVVRRARR